MFGSQQRLTRRLFDPVFRLPWPLHLLLGASSLGAMFWGLDMFDAAYEASKMPVGFMTEQTRFSATQTKAYYQIMLDQGSFSYFVQAQTVDFAYILATFLTGLFLASFVARLGGPGSWTRRFGITSAVLLMCGAGFDAAENLISFGMLANPLGFADWIAIPYSLSAVCKFAFGSFGGVLFGVALFMLMIERLLKSHLE